MLWWKVGRSHLTLKEVSGPSGSIAYQLGTRSANTTLRLKNGETQVLAGLISDEERSSANRLPGLGDIPTLGRLFSSTRDNNSKTEIVLLITPRIVRNVMQPTSTAGFLPSGTEAQPGLAPLSLRPGAKASTGQVRGGLSTSLSALPAANGRPGAPAGRAGRDRPGARRANGGTGAVKTAPKHRKSRFSLCLRDVFNKKDLKSPRF